MARLDLGKNVSPRAGLAGCTSRIFGQKMSKNTRKARYDGSVSLVILICAESKTRSVCACPHGAGLRRLRGCTSCVLMAKFHEVVLKQL